MVSESGLSTSKTPLSKKERKWVKIQPFLLSAGYKLRPRYDPNWTPSWGGNYTPNGTFEDSLHSYTKNALDAVRLADNQKVVLKRVKTDSTELQIIQYLSQIRDSRNHTIPLLEVISAAPNSTSILVMPYTRHFTHPAFHCRAEYVEAMQQFLEGLQFMHDNGVCHFDIAPQNMMMEESLVVPAGSHFTWQETHTGFPGIFSWNNRCSVSPVRYYYIDFGLSMYFRKGKDAALTTGTLRTFKTIPELSLTVPYNPFKVDIFQLGLTMHKLIDYPALKPFRPVADRMTSTDPNDRPEPAESLRELNWIANQIPPQKLRAPIVEKTGPVSYIAQSAMSIVRRDSSRQERYQGY
ncbi:kinase domain-containing protein [Favolaschia claudopus]|uniref:Kinase domain-containing protein n=1 Tax=Favolaschia claudopus TaxID=2862362 RepID=A0AAV9ZD24_9AGAR